MQVQPSLDSYVMSPPDKTPNWYYMCDCILTLLNAGHDVSFNAVITLYPLEQNYHIEIYDPLDDLPGAYWPAAVPMHDTFNNCPFLDKFKRHNDYLEVKYDNIEEAAELYLQICEWLKQSR